MKEELFEFLEAMKQPSSLEECKEPKVILGQEAFGRLFWKIKESQEKTPEILSVISHELPQMDRLRACCSAYFCGSMIEDVGVSNCGEVMVEFYCDLIKSCYEFLEFVSEQEDQEIEYLTQDQITEQILEKAFLEIPDAVRSYYGCNFITLAIMDIITRDHSSRKLLRQKNCYEMLEVIKEFIPNVDYVTQVYCACMRLPLLVLAPKEKRGFLAEVNDVTNCFHLLTFLEAELYKSGLAKEYKLKDYQFNEEIYQCATGEKMPFRGKTVNAHSQYYNYQVLNKTGNINTLVSDLIWGEMCPEAIPQFHGIATIIMDSETAFAGRSWGSEFVFCCHEGLNPYFHIERELTLQELQEKLSWDQ